ncbi:uncharacterized protein LOC113502937 [Trichoplusia ni]|uniref:Uncharacterized protein LOC113502937 n=1 Tax=Trichoplusia ni TaxID=7111 RepID=A0A7E5WIG6_TRINI|nr:uncharacterized protein LOC113502937 [Trichoplusia ni]
MLNSPGFDFAKHLDQNLYTYYLQEQNARDGNTEESLQGCGEPGGKAWPITVKRSLVRRLLPIVVLIGGLEIVTGIVLLTFVAFHVTEYDMLYATEDSKLISVMSFGGLISLSLSGAMLLTSIILEKRRLLWIYIINSTFLCVYIFVLSVMKIHFALLVLERDTYKIILPESRQFLLSTACVVGIVTMLGSVIHFIGNVTVFTFYNLKYIQPILFHNDP